MLEELKYVRVLYSKINVVIIETCNSYSNILDLHNLCTKILFEPLIL